MPKARNSNCQSARPFRLENSIQNYPWGTCNNKAFIPHLLGIEPIPDRPYAELWMGVHPNAPSSIIDFEQGPQLLSDWLAENPQERLAADANNTSSLPYLFKVLSAGEALSIQAHPNKSQAEQLHAQDPLHYPDDNHKPEIAIALDDLEALVGFISDESFIELLKQYPEINVMVTRNQITPTKLKEGIHNIFLAIDDNSDTIPSTITQLQKRLSQKLKPNDSELLFLDQFKKRGASDIGLIFLFFLNRVHLRSGEGIFLAPGVPHAYLKGNIIECMANSDNVVRLGLTDKFCDSSALKDILIYDNGIDYRVKTTKTGHVREYSTPATEFQVKSMELIEGTTELVKGPESLTMYLLVEGEICIHWGGDHETCTCVVKQGNSFIVPANLTNYKISARQSSKLYLVELT